MLELRDNVCEPVIYDKIYRLHSKALRNFLFYKYGDIEKAGDYAQEAFIKLWQNCLKVIPSKAKAYVFQIAKNFYLNDLKHQKVVLNYQKVETNTKDTIDPQFILEEKEYMKKLQKALSDLPDGQREVFLLNRMDKLKYREIADMLDISVKAVEKRMHKALMFLRETLGTKKI